MSEQSGGPGWWLASDGRWYPPPAPQQPPPQPQWAPPPQWASPRPPAQKSGTSPWVVVAVILLGLFALGGVGCVALGIYAVSEVDNEMNRRDAEIAEDVEIASCKPGQFGWFNAEVVVTNRSSERSNYSISVGFESEDGSVQYDTGYAFVSGLRPGQQRTTDATSLSDAVEKYRCEVLDVTRFSDE